MPKPEIVIALLAALAVASPAARAEQFVEDNVESRLLMLFKANAEAVQKRLPPQLEVFPSQAAPTKDANLVVVFYDRFHQLHGNAKPTGMAPVRTVVIVAIVKSRETGKPAFAVMRAFNPSREQVPGFYKAGVLGEVKHEMSSAEQALEPGQTKEAWDVSTPGGDTIRVRVDYARGVPTRSQRELQVFSAVQGDLFRIYRTDELGDVIQSVPTNVDRAKNIEYRFSIRDMADLFDAKTQLVAVTANPVFLRKVFLP